MYFFLAFAVLLTYKRQKYQFKHEIYYTNILSIHKLRFALEQRFFLYFSFISKDSFPSRLCTRIPNFIVFILIRCRCASVSLTNMCIDIVYIQSVPLLLFSCNIHDLIIVKINLFSKFRDTWFSLHCTFVYWWNGK